MNALRAPAALWGLLPVLLLGGCSRPGETASSATVRRVVPVATATRRDLSDSLMLQGEFRAYQEVELHAKVSGYLRSIPVDFGDQVQAGQILATLEVPELEADLAHAEAAYRRASADDTEARLESSRLNEVAKANPHLLAQQELDSAEAKEAAASATAAAAKADVAKYQTLITYSKITAPFAGIITQRTADPGALIQAGAGSPAPLLRLSENDRLRLDFPVAASAAGGVRVGDPIEIKLESSERRFKARVSRLSRRISLDTRTMEVEAEIPNPDLSLIPGMFADVSLALTSHLQALAVPIACVVAGPTPTVFLVQADGTIVERPVKLGLETPSQCEILSGLQPGDRVVVGQLSGLHTGEMVTPRASAFSAN